MRLDFRTGILTSFILPKGRKRRDYWDSIYINGGFYRVVTTLAFMANILWSLMVIISLFGVIDWGIFIRITVMTIILELIYKMAHYEYKYF
jgi:hypothetical protein